MKLDFLQQTLPARAKQYETNLKKLKIVEAFIALF